METVPAASTGGGVTASGSTPASCLVPPPVPPPGGFVHPAPTQSGGGGGWVSSSDVQPRASDAISDETRKRSRCPNMLAVYVSFPPPRPRELAARSLKVENALMVNEQSAPCDRAHCTSNSTFGLAIYCFSRIMQPDNGRT